MKQTFNTCDRCGANSQSLQRIKQFEIHMAQNFTKETSPEFQVLDLCYVCANGFIHWFGKINPFTGLHFEKETE